MGIVDMIKDAKNLHSFGAITESKIQSSEEILGLCFAEDYREYLKVYGAAAFDDHELTGICESKRLSVVETTKRARNYFKAMPGNLYVVEELGIDHILIMQDSKGTVYEYGPTDKKKKIGKSLNNYLFQ